MRFVKLCIGSSQRRLHIHAKVSGQVCDPNVCYLLSVNIVNALVNAYVASSQAVSIETD